MKNRTTKTAQKLKLFPEGIVENLVEPSGGDLPHIGSPPEQDALLKFERKYLPRVTGYCTANAYKMDDLFEDLKRRALKNGTLPKRFDEGTLGKFNWTLRAFMNLNILTKNSYLHTLFVLQSETDARYPSSNPLVSRLDRLPAASTATAPRQDDTFCRCQFFSGRLALTLSNEYDDPCLLFGKRGCPGTRSTR
jgi:uncharacterized Rmd1/YagE family protein